MTTQHEHDGTGSAASAAGPRPPVLALSVQQPWAWAIACGPKRVENRTWPHRYRGPIAVHASRTWDDDGEYSPLVRAAWDRATRTPLSPDAPAFHRGVIIAVAELTHICARLSGCDCGPWSARDQYHWHLSDVRPLADPIPARGRLGLWPLPDDIRAAVAAAARRYPA